MWMEAMGALGKLGGPHLSEQPRQVPQVRNLNRPPLKQIPPSPPLTSLHLRNTDQSQEGLFWMGGRPFTPTTLGLGPASLTSGSLR